MANECIIYIADRRNEERHCTGHVVGTGVLSGPQSGGVLAARHAGGRGAHGQRAAVRLQFGGGRGAPAGRQSRVNCVSARVVRSLVAVPHGWEHGRRGPGGVPQPGPGEAVRVVRPRRENLLCLAGHGAGGRRRNRRAAAGHRLILLGGVGAGLHARAYHSSRTCSMFSVVCEGQAW